MTHPRISVQVNEKGARGAGTLHSTARARAAIGCVGVSAVHAGAAASKLGPSHRCVAAA
jgi:hypothetical protein